MEFQTEQGNQTEQEKGIRNQGLVGRMLSFIFPPNTIDDLAVKPDAQEQTYIGPEKRTSIYDPPDTHRPETRDAIILHLKGHQ